MKMRLLPVIAILSLVLLVSLALVACGESGSGTDSVDTVDSTLLDLSLLEGRMTTMENKHLPGAVVSGHGPTLVLFPCNKGDDKVTLGSKGNKYKVRFEGIAEGTLLPEGCDLPAKVVVSPILLSDSIYPGEYERILVIGSFPLSADPDRTVEVSPRLEIRIHDLPVGLTQLVFIE